MDHARRTQGLIHNVNRREFLMASPPLEVPPRSDAQGSAPRCRLRLRFGVAQLDRYDPLAEVENLAAWGFDYIEPAVIKVMARSAPQFAEAVAKVKSTSIRVEVMNSFLPADLKVVGPQLDTPRLRDHIQQALAQADALGAKVIIFGAGGARTVPDGFSKERAWTQLQEFLRLVGDEITRRQYGMVIGIEALQKAESNIVNRSAEAYDLVRQTNHPKIRMIVDYFHLSTEKEDPSILKQARDYLVHIHFSDPTAGRRFPHRSRRHPGYAAFFANLREIGYHGRLSLEACTEDFQSDAPAGLAAVRALYSEASAG